MGGGGATLESRPSRDRLLLLYLIHLVLYWLSTFINIGPDNIVWKYFRL